MEKKQKATVPAQAHITTDEGLPIATDRVRLKSAISVLEKFHEDATIKLFQKWSFDEVFSLIEHTQERLTGITHKYSMSNESLLSQWADFMIYYSSVYHTHENLWGLKLEDEGETTIEELQLIKDGLTELQGKYKKLQYHGTHDESLDVFFADKIIEEVIDENK
jgi:hypothetical protein